MNRKIKMHPHCSNFIVRLTLKKRHEGAVRWTNSHLSRWLGCWRRVTLFGSPHRYHVFHGSPSKRGLSAVCWTDPRSEPWTEFSWISVGDQMEVWGPWPDLSCSPVINQRDVQLRRKLRLSPETRPFIYLFFLCSLNIPPYPVMCCSQHSLLLLLLL